MSSAVLALAYAGVALCYALLTGALLYRGARSWTAGLMTLAAVVTSCWAVSSALDGFGLGHPGAANLLAALRDGAWFAVVLALLRPAGAGGGVWLWLAVASALIVGVDAIFAATAYDAGPIFGVRVDPNATGLVVVILGLVLIENMVRNLSADQFWSAKYLGTGLSVLLLFQLIVRVPEFLTHSGLHQIENARPFIYLLALPLFVLTAVRDPSLQLRVHSSRKIVFHTAALILAGVLFEGIAVAAYIVRTYGGTGGSALAIVVGFVGVVGLVLAAASAAVRSRLRRFINENFFSYKYDYRLEWTKFIDALTSLDSGDVPMRVLRTLAEFVDSPGGALWVFRSSWKQLMPVAAWSFRSELAPMSPDDPKLAPFKSEDLACLELSAKEAPLDARAWVVSFPNAWLAVPLRYRGAVVGVAVLNKPRAPKKIDWEDKNLIQLVGLQLAAHLVQEETAQELEDSRRLAEFNKRIAFVLHDLKNATGQLDLLARNAEKFADNEEFRQDMVLTLRHSVTKLQELLGQLRGEQPVLDSGNDAVAESVDVDALVSAFAERQRRQGQPLCTDSLGSPRLARLGDRNAFLNVLEHVVGNAVEASPPGAQVRIGIDENAGSIWVRIEDHGPGMTPKFIADELFRPLKSTKKNGFGIGACQARQIMRDLGGDMDVRSSVGRGTTMILSLPANIETVGF